MDAGGRGAVVVPDPAAFRVLQSAELAALLSDRDFYSLGQFDANDPLKTPYVSGETGVAYELEFGQRHMWAMAAGTYTNGQELTVGAAGRLTAAAAAGIVVAFFDGPGATLAAGDLADVAIANFYTKA